MIGQAFRVEFDELITPDGLIYTLHNGANRFLIGGIGGQGLPPVEYQTQRGPWQDGETVTGFRYGPRVLQMVHRRNALTRAEYWDARADLLNFLRPSRTTDGTFQHAALRKYLPDGSIRDIDVRIDTGPQFSPGNSDRWDEYSFQEGLRFIASDPSFYDPEAVTKIITASGTVAELAYPASYPVTYGGSVLIDEVFYIDYTGTYRTFPLITIRGPLIDPLIINWTTDERIELDYTVASGSQITIDLRLGEKIVEDNQTPPNNLIGTVTLDSDIGTFHIEPEPRAVGGRNVLEIQGTGADASTRITFEYLTRYIGI